MGGVKRKSEKTFASGVGPRYPERVARKRRAPRRTGVAPAPPPPREFRQERARESYQKLLAAALELYGERGYHATQTPDIAERAGMSVGGLYRHFRDKHQIFVELMHRGLEANRIRQDALITAWEKAFAEGRADPRRTAETIVEWTWNALRNVPPDVLRTYLAMSYQDETFAALREQYDRYERQAFARVIDQLASARWIPSPLAAAKVLDLTVETLAVWAALHPGAESRGVKEATIDMLYRYLTPPQAQRTRKGGIGKR